MTLVESALCPLDSRVSKKHGLIHRSHYRYRDKNGSRKQATTHISAAFGLAPSDDFYLWGLLALTFSQPSPEPTLVATPHYCLSQLGLIDGGKGGKTYTNFRDALDRLAGVIYKCDAFYDPIRKERSRQTFQILSSSRPIDTKSSRAWRIEWNKFFFDFAAHGDGHFGFDLATYRELDHATRRLFLLLRKIFHRKWKIHFSVMELAVHQLGYDTELEGKALKAKVKRCLKRLLERKVISLGMLALCELRHARSVIQILTSRRREARLWRRRWLA